MDVRDLQVFLSVAKHLNFTRAGEEVHLSQPSVSVRIRLLEEYLGVKLFEKWGRKIALTEAGRLLQPFALRVVAALDDAHHAIGELRGIARGSLKIGASTTPGIYLVPGIIASFKQKYPKVEMDLQIKDTRQVEEGVVSNEFDFGFVGGHPISNEIEIVPWRTDEIVLVAPPGCLLARRKRVAIRDLKGVQIISRESGSATQSAVNEKLTSLGVAMQRVMEIDNPEAIKQAVKGGLGLAFVSKLSVETELRARTLLTVKVSGLEVSRELKIVFRKDKHLSDAARAFIKIAQS